MSLYVKKTDGTAYNVVFLKILEDIPGGVTIKTSALPSDATELKAGTLLDQDASTAGLYNVVKNGKSNSTQSAATSVLLVPGHMFKVGDFVAVDGKTTGSTISSITHTSATTDTVVVGTALGTLATASLVHQVTAAGGTVVLYTADSILRDNLPLEDVDGTTLYNVAGGAVRKGTVDTVASPYWYRTADKTALVYQFMFI